MDLETAKRQMMEESRTSEDYKDTIIVVELELLEQRTGIIRGELIIEEEVETAGSLLLPITEPEPDIWEGMGSGDKRAYALLVDSRKEKFREKMVSLFSRSIEDGRIQDFIPGITSPPTN